jgi:hypothetical protein
MVTVSQIREHLVDLLADFNRDAFESFEEWLASASWNMHLTSELSAQNFVGDIQLRIAEAEAEHQTDDWLKCKLKSILSVYSLSISNDPRRIIYGSSVDFTEQKEWAISSADRSRVVASV